MATVNATWKQKSTGNIIHPETDVDQLKSSGQNALASIITTLLKSATTAQARAAIESAAAVHQHSTGDIQSFASNVVSAIGEETLAALGVRYSITTNGYICFGQLFGGLILQWGLGNMFAGTRNVDHHGVINVPHQRSYVQTQNLAIGYMSMWDETVDGVAVCHVYSSTAAPSNMGIAFNWFSFGYI